MHRFLGKILLLIIFTLNAKWNDLANIAFHLNLCPFLEMWLLAYLPTYLRRTEDFAVKLFSSLSLFAHPCVPALDLLNSLPKFTEFERWGRSVRYYYFPAFKDKRQSSRELKLIFSQLRENCFIRNCKTYIWKMSQDHKVVQAGRDLRRALLSISPHKPWGQTRLLRVHLWARPWRTSKDGGCTASPGNLSAAASPHKERMFPYSQYEPFQFQCIPVVACFLTPHCWEPGSMTSPQVLRGCCVLPPKLSFLSSRQPWSYSLFSMGLYSVFVGHLPLKWQTHTAKYSPPATQLLESESGHVG